MLVHALNKVLPLHFSPKISQNEHTTSDFKFFFQFFSNIWMFFFFSELVFLSWSGWKFLYLCEIKSYRMSKWELNCKSPVRKLFVESKDESVRFSGRSLIKRCGHNDGKRLLKTEPRPVWSCEVLIKPKGLVRVRKLNICNLPRDVFW